MAERVPRVVAPDAEGISVAVACLTAGELVAFPTETVFGVGARADDAAAVKKIYAAKGRPADKPLSILVGSTDLAKTLASDWPAVATRLADAFWPGPLTLVLKRSALVDPAVTAGGDTVGIRIPAHDVTLRLLSACPFALAAPSANRSGSPEPRSVEDVVAGLGESLALVVADRDGSRPTAVGSGIPSTVVDATDPDGKVRILRQGGISRAALNALVPVA